MLLTAKSMTWNAAPVLAVPRAAVGDRPSLDGEADDRACRDKRASALPVLLPRAHRAPRGHDRPPWRALWADGLALGLWPQGCSA
jgi:hypothetical protein